jgi:hypothetical protein
MINPLLFLHWTIAGLTIAVGVYARRWRFAQAILVPEAILVRAEAARRRHVS